MKFYWKTLVLAFVYIAILGILLLFGVSIFISGPKYVNEANQEKIITKIEDQIKENSLIHRHVFRYVIYVVKQENRYLFFNENAEAIASRPIDQEAFSKAVKKMQEEYDLLDCNVQIGYGIDGPVYTAENEQALVLLDYDTLKEIYYLKKEGS